VYLDYVQPIEKHRRAGRSASRCRVWLTPTGWAAAENPSRQLRNAVAALGAFANWTSPAICAPPRNHEASEKTPLTALATQAVVGRAMRRFGYARDGLSGVVIGGHDIGQALAADARVAVVSATGSTAMGRDIGPRLAARCARAVL
jgi:hypothetical protein